jgi:hypothetical protein
MEYFYDATQDSFGSGEWEHADCVTPSWLPQVECPDSKGSSAG